MHTRVAHQPRAGRERQIGGVHRQRQRFASDRAVAGDPAGAEPQIKTGKAEISAAARQVERLPQPEWLGGERSGEPGEAQFGAARDEPAFPGEGHR